MLLEPARLAGIGGRGVLGILDVGIAGLLARAARIDLHDRADDRDAGRIDHDRIAAHLQADLLLRLQDDLGRVQFAGALHHIASSSDSRSDTDLPDDGQIARLLDALVATAVDMHLVVVADRDIEVAALLVAVGVLPADDGVAIAAGGLIGRAEGADVQTVLRTDQHLLAASGIVEPQHMELVLAPSRPEGPNVS